MNRYGNGWRHLTAWLLLAGLPLAAGAASDMAEDACAGAITTLAINHCADTQVQQAEGQLEVYLAAAQQRYAADPEALRALQAAQQSWSAYRQAHCDAVYALWREGSIRGLMHSDCMRQQTLQRSHDLWQVYLTSMEGGPPLLPEPLSEAAE